MGLFYSLHVAVLNYITNQEVKTNVETLQVSYTYNVITQVNQINLL